MVKNRPEKICEFCGNAIEKTIPRQSRNCLSCRGKKIYKKAIEKKIKQAKMAPKVVKKRLRIRFKVFSRNNFTCQYCGRRAPDVVLEVDHIKPRAKGGLDSIENFITSCRDCNLGKGDILL